MTHKPLEQDRFGTIANFHEWKNALIHLMAPLKSLPIPKSQVLPAKMASNHPIQLGLTEPKSSEGTGPNSPEATESDDLVETTAIVPVPKSDQPNADSPSELDLPDTELDKETESTVDNQSDLAVQPIPEDNFDEEASTSPQPLRWGWIWMAIFLISANVGAGAFLWMRSIPKATNCQQISGLAPDWERLQCAQQLAQSGRLVDLLTAISVVEPWAEDHSLYPESRRLIGVWSKSLMTIARRKLYHHDLKSAAAIANQIPPTSPMFEEAQNTIKVWRQDWDKGSALYQKVQAALKARNWILAEQLSDPYLTIDNDYWRFRLKQVRDRIATDELDWKRLQRAKAIASKSQPGQLVTAITLTQQILPGGYVWAEAAQQRQAWSRELLKLATEQLVQKRYKDAVATAQLIPADSQIKDEVDRIIQVGRAIEGDYPNKVSASLVPQKIWETIVLLEVAQQIQPEEPTYPLVSKRLPSMESYLADLITFQSGLLVAGIEQPRQIALPLAARHVQKIRPDSPLRLEAQTKAAHWNKEILRIQDRPLLQEANRLANRGTIENTKKAIATARKIPPSHPLYPEAQQAVQGFQLRLAALEDKVTLDQAKALARKGSLEKALALVEQITDDRPLAAEAQAIQNDIYIQQQVADAKPLLNDAIALAKAKNYTEAILAANEIPWDHPLYQEAQSLINQWIAARDGLGDL